MGYYGFYLLASIANIVELQCKKLIIIWIYFNEMPDKL